MIRSRPALPHGHGELLTRPPFEKWASLLEENHELRASFSFEIGGVPAVQFARAARREAVAEAVAFSARLGVPVVDPAPEPGRLVVTGHQPELFHPGVWAKDFLAQRLADETGAVAIDLVVDTDAFDTVALVAPCFEPEVTRCRQFLAVGREGSCFACTPVPDAGSIEAFCLGGAEMLRKLPAPALLAHFESFCVALRSAADDARNLAELTTFARRRFEAPAGTTYLELPVTALARTASFVAYAIHIARDAAAFARAYNEELATYRAETGTRSAAQPFPDLKVEATRTELPFWVVSASGRQPAWVRGDGDDATLLAGDVHLCTLEELQRTRRLEGDAVLAPRALTLTMYARLFLGDLFVHGVGGGRYDRVTDAVTRRFFGTEVPHFAVASLTMYLPLGAHVVTDEELADAKARVNRLEHNPDSMLAEVEFDNESEHRKAFALAEEKTRLVSEIALPGADKKAIGQRIRAINAELAEMLAPLAEESRRELALLEGQRATGEVLTDRTYPFCLWSPLEVQDKAR